MRGPPHGQKEHQQPAIQMLTIFDPAGFDVPAAAFAILEGGFYPHAPCILLDACGSGFLITDEDPGLLVLLFPCDTHPGFQRFLLPDPGFAKPAVARFEDDVSKGLPGFLQLLAHPTSDGMLLTDAKQVMPAALLTQLDQRHSC